MSLMRARSLRLLAETKRMVVDVATYDARDT
jgi:hypothetical protein